MLDASKIDHPIDLNPLKATMPTTTPTILDQISAEKTKVSERLARLDTDRATVATQSDDRDLEAAIAMSIPFLPQTPGQVGYHRG